MKSPIWKELLQKLRVFETVRDDKKFDKLLDEGASTERVFAKGDVIIRRGWIGDSIFLIGSGAVELLLEPSEGDPIVLAVIGRGEMFGEMAFFDRDKRTERSATARAKEPSTLLEIHASGLQEILDERHEHARSGTPDTSERDRAPGGRPGPASPESSGAVGDQDLRRALATSRG